MSETIEKPITNSEPEDVGLLTSIFNEIISNPLNLGIVCVITFLLYKIAKTRSSKDSDSTYQPQPELPKLRKDFTVQELKTFDGTQPDGRVLVAVNGNIYDVTAGKRFYGPGKFILCVLSTDN